MPGIAFLICGIVEFPQDFWLRVSSSLLAVPSASFSCVYVRTSQLCLAVLVCRSEVDVGYLPQQRFNLYLLRQDLSM